MSTRPPKELYDPIRKEWVRALPEEHVRQCLIRHLLEDLKYPASLLACELSLDQLPHLATSQESIPRRRADIVCFSKDLHPNFSLFPLVLIECKAVPLSSAALNQLIGYNHYVKAPFICLANDTELRFGYWDEISKDYTFISHIPPYQDLLSSL